MVLLTEVDRLTKDAQHALRRTMEKYCSTCRLILCCNSSTRVIPAIRSRCLAVRVAAPTHDEVDLLSFLHLEFVLELLHECGLFTCYYATRCSLQHMGNARTAYTQSDSVGGSTDPETMACTETDSPGAAPDRT